MSQALFTSPFIPVENWINEHWPKLSDSRKAHMISEIKKMGLARKVAGHMCFDVIAYSRKLEKEADEFNETVKSIAGPV